MAWLYNKGWTVGDLLLIGGAILGIGAAVADGINRLGLAMIHEYDRQQGIKKD